MEHRAALKSVVFSRIFKSIAISAVSVGFAFACISAASAKAAGSSARSAATANRVALIDFQVAILQTEEGKAAKAKIEKEVEARKKELLSQQQELKKLEEDFEAKRAVLSEDEKNKSARDLQAKFMAFQRSQMNLDQEVRQKEMQETQKIFQKLSALVEEYAKKHSFDLVFEKGAGAVLYIAQNSDITGDIVTLYNARHKVKK
ncbi:MAG: OmpH family outer membrane protein [Proteobacteria bacterium]|nr:OmpH family outer membrane protein [Pseudomonadota bacterium]